MASIAALFVDLKANLRPLDSGLGMAHKKLSGFDSSIRGVSGAASSALAGIAVGGIIAGVGAVAVGLYKGVQAAANLGESISKAQQVFGGSASVVTGAAEQMAATFGTSKQSFIDAASAIGLIGEGAGMSESASANLGVELAKLADDASSFYNVPLDEALGKIRSGLVGESEPLRAFGLTLSETAVQQEAMRMGLATSAKGLTEQAKVMARVSLIQKGLSKATGDHARTMTSSTNRQRELAGRLENAMTDVGTAVMPVWQELVNQVNSIGVAIGGFITANMPLIKSWSASAVESIRGVMAGAADLYESFVMFLGSGSSQIIEGGIGATFTWLKGLAIGVLSGIGDALATAGVAMRNWDAVAQIAGLQFQQAIADIVPTIGWLGSAIGAFLSWFTTNWTSMFQDAFTVVLTALKSFVDIFLGAFDQIKGFASDPLHFEVDFSKFNPVENIKKMATDLSNVQLTTPPLEIPALQLDHTESDRQIADITAGITDRETERAAEKSKQAADDAAAAAGAEGAGGTKPGAQPGAPGAPTKAGKTPDLYSSAEQFSKRLTESSLTKDDTNKNIEAHTGETVTVLRAIQENTSKGNSNGPTPAVAVGPAI